MRDHFARLRPRLWRPGWSNFQHAWQEWVSAPAGHLQVVVTPNPEQVMLAAAQPDFAQALYAADVHAPDGTFLVLADHWWRWRRRPPANLSPLAGRVRGRSVLAWWLQTQQTAAQPIRTLLIGGQPGVAVQLARQFDAKQTWCRGVSGYDDVSSLFASHQTSMAMHTITADKHLDDIIWEWQPRVIFVAFGAPWQERWLSVKRASLAAAGVRVAMACGGAFDVVSGRLPAPPRVVASVGLEWLWRLVWQPWRWRRQSRVLQFIREVI